MNMERPVLARMWGKFVLHHWALRGAVAEEPGVHKNKSITTINNTDFWVGLLALNPLIAEDSSVRQKHWSVLIQEKAWCLKGDKPFLVSKMT